MSKKKYIINPEAEVSDSFYIKPDPLKKEYLFCWDFDNTIIKGNSHDFFDTLNITGSVPKELIDKFLADEDNCLRDPVNLLPITWPQNSYYHLIRISRGNRTGFTKARLDGR